MTETRLDRVAAWYMQRRWRGAGGRLLYITDAGDAVDLGAYTGAELAGLARAVDVARRSTPSARERALMGAFVDAGRRMRYAVARIPK